MINQKSSKKDHDGEVTKGIPLASLKLTPSKVRTLHENGIRCIDDLKGITFKELYALPGLGKKTVSDIIKYTNRVFLEPPSSGLFDETQRIPSHVADINLLEQNLTVRLRNVLSAANLSLIRDVLPYSEALVKSLPNMGSKTLTELKEYLTSKGIAWGGVPYTIDDSVYATTQEHQPVIQQEDKPLPEYLYNHLSVRARNLLNKAGIDSCVKLLKLNPADVLKFKNAGRYTWDEIEKIKPDILRYLKEGTYWCINYKKHANYEIFLEAFLSSFRPYPKCDLIFDHRLAIRGSGKDKTLEETAKFLSVTRERIRQIETKVRKHYFGAAGRSMIESFLALARDTMLSFSGAANPEQFAEKVDEVTGWSPSTIPDPLINLLVCFEVLHYDRQKKIIIIPDFYPITNDMNRLFVQFCSDRSRPFSAIGYDDFLVYLKECEKVTQYPISFEAYKVCGNDLLGKNTLPADKKHQLKAFINGLSESSIEETGDKRRISSKLLEILRNAKKALPVGKWLELANRAFPKEKIRANQIRGLCTSHANEIINYDRGLFIWHEHVSISHSLVMWFEDQFLAHMLKYGVDVISVYRIFEEKKKDLLEDGIPTQSLLYFLLKRNSSGRINYPEYPKVSLPNAEGGSGVFTQIMRTRLFQKNGITLAELHDFYSNILCADKRYVLAIPELTRRGALYYLAADSKCKTRTIARSLPVFNFGEPHQPGQTIADNERDLITSVLEDRFRNGFRLNSEIEIQRFKNFYEEKHKCALPLNDSAFCQVIETMGIRHSGKVFIPSAEEKARISDLLNKAFETGAKTIFYEAFFDYHINELSELRINSPEMLRDFLIGLNTNLHFESAFFAHDEVVRPEDEIASCFDSENTVLSHAQLVSKRPYIPPAKIKRLLYQKQCFVSVSKTGRYSHVNRLHITDNDRQKALSFIEARLLNSDYVSLLELDVGDIVERNHDIPVFTARELLCRHCLGENYVRNGSIITKKGTRINVVNIIKNYCREREHVTFAEINSLEQALCERTHSSCLIAAYEEMIRVREDLFVADHSVAFDIPRIDSMLELYCPCDYIPLQAVKDFSLFPYSGYPWNSFLLESYVRRFSRIFRFDVLSVNSVSAGAIIRKGFAIKDYRQILSAAVAKANILLNENDIVSYLFRNGYIGRKVLSEVETVRLYAQSMRERRI
jgi:DNA-directed RNA polymerase alpha subunit